MDNYYTHVPRELAHKLKEKYHAHIFVETGTYKGWTTLWASENFDTVYTIELSDALFLDFNENIRPLAVHDNIISCQGDSREVLSGPPLWDVLSSTPCFCWLDAHWFHLDTVAGTKEDVPLIGELKVILDTQIPHVILIDDAPLISKSMKERDDNYRSWPTFDQIEPLIRERYTAYYTGNVLVLEPKEHI